MTSRAKVDDIHRMIGKVEADRAPKFKHRWDYVLRMTKPKPETKADYDRDYRRNPYGRTNSDRKYSTHNVFSYDEKETLDKILPLSDVRMHVIPGYDARVLARKVLRPPAAGAAMGVGIGTIDSWLRQKKFPEPIGYYLVGFRKIPAYTVQEILTYLHLIAVETGGKKTNRLYYDFPHLSGMLHAAAEVLKTQITADGPRARWATAIKPLPGGSLEFLRQK